MTNNNKGEIPIIVFLLIIIMTIVGLTSSYRHSTRRAEASQEYKYVGKIKSFTIVSNGGLFKNAITTITLEDGKMITTSDVDIASDKCVYMYNDRYFVCDCKMKKQ